MNSPEPAIFVFDEYTLDAEKRLILKGDGSPVGLTPKVFDLLLYLVRHGGEIVDKDELMSEIWADTIVEENNLNQNISILRRVLGEKRGEHRFIATVPGRGYKFVAKVVQSSPVADLGGGASEERQSVSTRSKTFSIGIIPILVITVIGTASYILWKRSRAEVPHSLRSVAVLPFKPIVAESRDESLEMGIADTLIARLSNSREITVRPLGSVRRFGGMDQDSLIAGQELGVDTVLDGSTQRSGDNIRVNVRLIDVSNGASLWSATYDEQFTNIFSVQDRIAGKVADALKIRLNESRGAGSNKGQTSDPEAYRLYLQGRYFSQKITEPEVRRGIQFFNQAIGVDPTYALAYAGMADAYRSLPINGDVPSADVMPEAKAAAERALAIDPDIADAHIALGYVSSWYEYDWVKAEAEFKTALELSPNNADAHRGYSILLTCLGRHDEAIVEMRRAVELDPLSLITNALAGQAYFFGGQDEKAQACISKTLELEPNFWVAHIQLARIQIRKGNYQAAVAEAEKARQFSGGNGESISLGGFAEAKAGRPQNAVAALKVLKVMRERGLVTYYNTAVVYNGLNQKEEAIEQLLQALKEHDVRMILLKIDPKWDNLRSDPRIAAIIARMNL
jgi:DNA-binding winged helix-turn-helix (wHTH) protein/TolB-like protein/Tfp pilus assembly protein PilF